MFPGPKSVSDEDSKITGQNLNHGPDGPAVHERLRP